MESENKKISYSVPGNFKNGEQNMINNDVNQRLTLIEEKIFKKLKRLRATEAQRFLIFQHLGLIQKVISLTGIQQKQKNLIISVLLDIDPDNAKKFLSELAKKDKPLLETVTNYQFLIDFFNIAGLPEQEAEVEKIFVDITAMEDEIKMMKKEKK